MKRKVYVMDCGDFIKIGVSSDPVRRAVEIPFTVSRIKATPAIRSVEAFRLERAMHHIFESFKEPSVPYNEYFRIPFKYAVRELIEQFKANDCNAPVMEMLNFLEEEEREKLLEKEIVKKIKEALPNMDERSKGYFLGYAEAMASKSEMAEPDKKEESDGRNGI